ncbi:MAG: hypothetical protein JXJ17_06770 [Anaerolineae bacterium]|nr:hypothetical protein [Anaerolineae bacterium]
MVGSNPAAPDPEFDLLVVEALASDLKAYLTSKTLYWPLRPLRRASLPLPPGTLGGVFLRLHRLRALVDLLDGEQRVRFQESAAQIEETLGRYPDLAAEKMLREVKGRMDGWGRYLEEVTAMPQRYESEYPTQVEGRTVIALLMDTLDETSERRAFAVQIDRADAHLRLILDRHPFIWHESLAGAFPEDRFWWLYGWPRH